MTDRVCAVVVTYNRQALLPLCLDALLDQVRPPDTILVVDNGSRDGTPRLVAREYPHVRTLLLPHNAGAAGGFAEGMAWAFERSFEWLWLMDDDVAADRDCLKELIEVSLIGRKHVVVPRRLAPDGEECANEAVLVEESQRFDMVRVDPARERYRLIDLFTFEGPLIHRSVVEAVGLPDRNLFIRGEDIAYAVRINRRCGALSCALAARAIMRRQLPSPWGIIATSRVKAWMTGDPTYEVVGDEDHWKMVYALRNRHIVWHRLGWQRRRLRLLIMHLGYIAADLIHALRHGWSWSLRLEWNARAWLLGLLARDTAFLDPEVYRARLESRQRRKKKPPR